MKYLNNFLQYYDTCNIFKYYTAYIIHHLSKSIRAFFYYLNRNYFNFSMFNISLDKI